MNKHLILIIIFLITIIYYNIFNKNIIEKHTSLNPVILSSNFNNDNYLSSTPDIFLNNNNFNIKTTFDTTSNSFKPHGISQNLTTCKSNLFWCECANKCLEFDKPCKTDCKKETTTEIPHADTLHPHSHLISHADKIHPHSHLIPHADKIHSHSHLIPHANDTHTHEHIIKLNLETLNKSKNIIHKSGTTGSSIDQIKSNTISNKNSIFLIHGVWPKNPEDGLIYEQGGTDNGMWIGVWRGKFLVRGYNGRYEMPYDNDNWNSNSMIYSKNSNDYYGVMARLSESQTASLYNGKYHVIIIEFSVTNKNVKIWIDNLDIFNPIVIGALDENKELYKKTLVGKNPGNFNTSSNETVKPNNDKTKKANSPLEKLQPYDSNIGVTPYFWWINYDANSSPHNETYGSITTFKNTFILD